jgi:molybdopterin-containing oxidoreductase family membrane subunit
MSEATVLQPYLRPLQAGGRGFAIAAFLLSSASAYWLYYSVRLLTEGHLLLGTSSYGAIWGITVANIVHIIGISHVGIAVSATVRVLDLRRYRNVARLAEILTLVALAGAVLNIGLDVGRPDRFITKSLVHGKWYAPMVWSMTVIILYFMASSAYLYLSMRRDLWWISGLRAPARRVFRLLALGYRDTPGERRRQEQALYWLAISLVPIMVSVHSVYGLIFGVLSPKPGWYNPLQAPYFVLAAIVSGFSAIIVVLLRWAYSWRDLLTDRVFKVFGSFLAFVVFLYIYFLVSEHLTAQFATLPSEKAISSALLYGRFSALFWVTTIAGLLLPFSYLFIQGIRTKFVSVGWTAAAALMVNLALWSKRFLLVVPAQYEAHLPLPRPAVPYSPTYAEIVVTLGTYAVAGLVFLVLIRMVPVIELPRLEEEEAPPEPPPVPSTVRRTIVLLTLVAGLFMIGWGVLTRDYTFAPLKWVLGLALLVCVPLEWCMIPDPPGRKSAATPD